jgi:hypothetical protein
MRTHASVLAVRRGVDLQPLATPVLTDLRVKSRHVADLKALGRLTSLTSLRLTGDIADVPFASAPRPLTHLGRPPSPRPHRTRPHATHGHVLARMATQTRAPSVGRNDRLEVRNASEPP